jgi:hypothetical protein
MWEKEGPKTAKALCDERIFGNEKAKIRKMMCVDCGVGEKTVR